MHRYAISWVVETILSMGSGQYRIDEMEVYNDG